MQTLDSALNTHLRSIIKKAKQLAELDSLVKKLLDPDIATHCSVANLEKNTLTIMVDSAAYGTRIGFQKQQLLQAIKEQFKDIRAIRCKINLSE